MGGEAYTAHLPYVRESTEALPYDARLYRVPAIARRDGKPVPYGVSAKRAENIGLRSNGFVREADSLPYGYLVILAP